MRLRHGGLGGVMDFSTFEARLETSTTIEPLVSRQLSGKDKHNSFNSFKPGVLFMGHRQTA